MRTSRLQLLIISVTALFFIPFITTSPQNWNPKYSADSCECLHLSGQALFECMNELSDQRYKINLAKMTKHKNGRIEYFKRLLRNSKDYKKLFAKYTPEQWEYFWENKLFEHEKGYLPKTKDEGDKLVKALENAEWWYDFYWIAGISVVTCGVGGAVYYVSQSKVYATLAGAATVVAGAAVYEKVQEKNEKNPTLKKVNEV